MDRIELIDTDSRGLGELGANPACAAFAAVANAFGVVPQVFLAFVDHVRALFIWLHYAPITISNWLKPVSECVADAAGQKPLVRITADGCYGGPFRITRQL